MVREKALRFFSKFLSFGILKYFNSFHILQRFIKSLSFFCKHFKVWNIPNFFIDNIGKNFVFLNKLSELQKNWKISFFFSSLNRIFNRLNCFKQAIWYMKLWSNSINFIDWITLGKLWVFQAVYLTFEVVKLINTILRLNHFAKKLRFSNKLFQL